MEAAMLYNLPILFGFYAVIAGFRCALPGISGDLGLLIPLFAAFCGWMWCHFSTDCVVILCLVANAINTLLVQIIPVGFLKAESPLRFSIKCFLGLFIFCQILGVIYCSQRQLTQFFEAALYVFGILAMYLSMFLLVGLNPTPTKQSSSSFSDSEKKAKITFVSLVALSIPVMVAGPVTLLAWEEVPRASSWYTLLSAIIPICAFTLIHLNGTTIHHCSSAPSNAVDAIRSGVIAVSVLALCPSALDRGHGYYVAKFVSRVAWVDIVVNILFYLLFK